MPGYYQPRPMAGQLPLTPPDSASGYYSNMNYSQDPYQQPPVSQSRHDSAYDYQQAYMQPAVAPAPPTYQYQQGAFQPTTSLPPIQNFYEPMGAPILPPLRINDRVSFADDYQRRLQQEQQQAAAREQQRQASTEEKATGGVSAKLDYDMEHMTDFVTDATSSIFQHTMHSQPSFHKWVKQVLSATRLPSATILLSLHYLNDRLSNYPDSVVAGENQIYRLLAVALILGSKFLDDNTFINRSWSDVTAIKVTELNKLEMTWLGLFDWRLHVDPYASNGLQAWIESWKKYDAEKYDLRAKQLQQAQQAQQVPARLSPLDTNVYRHTTTSRDRLSPYPTPHTATSTRAYEQSFSGRSSQFSTPYTASDPWATSTRPMEDYYNKRPSRYETYAEMEEANRRASEERARQTAFQYGNSNPSNYYQTPTYSTGWDSAWSSAHRYDCNCSTCAYSHHCRPYPLTSGYTAQTVMG